MLGSYMPPSQRSSHRTNNDYFDQNDDDDGWGNLNKKSHSTSSSCKSLFNTCHITTQASERCTQLTAAPHRVLKYLRGMLPQHPNPRQCVQTTLGTISIAPKRSPRTPTKATRATTTVKLKARVTEARPRHHRAA